MGLGANSQSGNQSGWQNFASNPFNVSNPALYGLGNQTANAFNQVLGAYGGGGTETPYNGQISPFYGNNNGYQFNYNNPSGNPFVAPVTGQQQGFLNNLPNLAYGQNAGNAGNAAGTLTSQAYQPSMLTPAFAATGQAQNIAPQFTIPGGPVGSAQNVVNYASDTNFGVPTAQTGADYASGANFGRGSAALAQGFAAGGQNLAPSLGAVQNEMNPMFAQTTAVNPITQSVIQAATNPLIQSFNAQTIPGLQGTFTAAGQRGGEAGTGPLGGSSAYNTAGANALTGLGANLGATAAGIINPTYQTALGIQAQAPLQYAAQQGQVLSGLESSAQTRMASEAAKAAAINQAAQTQASTAGTQTQALNQSVANQGAMLTAAQTANLAPGAQFTQEQQVLNSGLQSAAQTSQGVSTAQLQDTINALTASSLPQATQQYGINQGIQFFNSQMQQLMTLIGLGGQMAQPTIGNASWGNGANTGSSSGKGFSI